MNGPDEPGGKRDQKTPPAVFSAPPSPKIEKKVRETHDLDAEADLGSDESMDASDPSTAAQPGSRRNDQPAPSSGFPE